MYCILLSHFKVNIPEDYGFLTVYRDEGQQKKLKTTVLCWAYLSLCSSQENILKYFCSSTFLKFSSSYRLVVNTKYCSCLWPLMLCVRRFLMQHSGQRPPVLPIFIGVFLQMPGQYPKLGCDCFLPHPFQSTLYSLGY